MTDELTRREALKGAAALAALAPLGAFPADAGPKAKVIYEAICLAHFRPVYECPASVAAARAHNRRWRRYGTPAVA